MHRHAQPTSFLDRLFRRPSARSERIVTLDITPVVPDAFTALAEPTAEHVQSGPVRLGEHGPEVGRFTTGLDDDGSVRIDVDGPTARLLRGDIPAVSIATPPLVDRPAGAADLPQPTRSRSVSAALPTPISAASRRDSIDDYTLGRNRQTSWRSPRDYDPMTGADLVDEDTVAMPRPIRAFHVSGPDPDDASLVEARMRLDGVLRERLRRDRALDALNDALVDGVDEFASRLEAALRAMGIETAAQLRNDLAIAALVDGTDRNPIGRAALRRFEAESARPLSPLGMFRAGIRFASEFTRDDLDA